MNLAVIGRRIAEQRRARGLTLEQVAASAGIGRSTLSALEGGKLPELGFAKVARTCAAVGLVLDLRAPALEAPLMLHRHLTDEAGRDLSKAAIADIIVRGDISAWRGLAQALRGPQGGRLARRVQDVTRALGQDDPKVRAFAMLLPDIVRRRRSASARG